MFAAARSVSKISAIIGMYDLLAPCYFGSYLVRHCRIVLDRYARVRSRGEFLREIDDSNGVFFVIFLVVYASEAVDSVYFPS